MQMPTTHKASDYMLHSKNTEDRSVECMYNKEDKDI